MIALIAAGLIAVAPADGPPVDAELFGKLIRAKVARLKSAAFVYEGTSKWIGPAGIIEDPEAFGDEFQGAFFLRGDGAALADVYRKGNKPTASVVHWKRALLKGKVERVSASLDAKARLDPGRDVQVGRGNLGSFTGPDTPANLLMLWVWMEAWWPGSRGYAFRGWEDVDGHPCLAIQIDEWGEGHRKDLDFRRYWIDMGRDGHVLKLEQFHDGKLAARIDEIRLAETPLEGGGTYWLPIRSRLRAFGWGDKTYASALTETVTLIVAGSVRLNADLPDSLFSIRRPSGLPLLGELDRIGRSADPYGLRALHEAQPPAPEFRTDPVGIRKTIDEHLAEAERQKTILEASSPARQTFPGSALPQIALAGTGVALIGGVLFWRWRHR